MLGGTDFDTEVPDEPFETLPEHNARLPAEQLPRP